MKKRLVSFLLTGSLLLTMLPTAALAEDAASPACTCETACTAEAMDPDCPICGAEGAVPADCAKCAGSTAGEVKEVKNNLNAPPATLLNEDSEEAQTEVEEKSEEDFEKVTEGETEHQAEEKPDAQPKEAAKEATDEADGSADTQGEESVPVTLAAENGPAVTNGENVIELNSSNINQYLSTGLTDGGYTLTEDVTIGSGSLQVKGDVTLDLNGHTLEFSEGRNVASLLGFDDGSHLHPGIFVYNEGSNATVPCLTLKDSSENKTGTLDIHGFGSCGILVASNGSLNMTGGTITNSHEGSMFDEFGNGIYLINGTATMSGGKITNEKSSGVWVTNGSTFTMSDKAEISNCGTTYILGGGVYVDVDSSISGSISGSRFNMNGGTITNCTARGGGGVYVDGNSSFNMSAGSITGCSALSYQGSSGSGGGVYLADGSFLYMNGGYISGCKAETTGDGIYTAGGTISKNGGTIKGGIWQDYTFYNNTYHMEGLGTKDLPFQISTPKQLLCFQYIVNGADNHTSVPGACAEVTAGSLDCDIYLSGISWTPIGTKDHPYTGTFIGNYEGYVTKYNDFDHPSNIHGLCISSSDDAAGLFGYVKDATIQNITVWDSSITNNTGDYSGGIVAHASGNTTIENCTNNSRVWGGPVAVGGIVGYAEGTTSITNCKNNNKGSVDDGLNIGGIVGYAKDSVKITGCTNSRPVTNGIKNIGGIIGLAEGTVTITDCHNTADIAKPYSSSEQDEGVGGIVGRADNATIENCSNEGSVSTTITQSRAGGIAGYAQNSTIENCTNTGSVSTNASTSSAGGIAGKATNGSIESCANQGHISATNSNCYVGGIVGYTTDSVTVSICYNTGEIEGFSIGNNGSYTGGIVGNAYGYPNQPSFTDCYNVGKVHKGWLVGGIAGRASGTISNCYNTGEISESISSDHPNDGLLGSYGGNPTVTNTYYLDTSAPNGYNSRTTSRTGLQFADDSAVLTSLINGRSNSPWNDTCKYLDATGKTQPVFKGQGYDHTHTDNWQHDADTHWDICSCNVVLTAQESHTWGAWTSNGNGTHSRRCTTAGCTVSAQTEKCADANGDSRCDACGADLRTGHEHSGGTATCRTRAKCDICGAEYGSLNPANHTDLQHSPARAATETAEGNIEYWYCTGCAKFFADAAGTQELPQAATRLPKLAQPPKSAAAASATSPATADADDPALWTALLLLSGSALLALAAASRKRRNH